MRRPPPLPNEMQRGACAGKFATDYQHKSANVDPKSSACKRDGRLLEEDSGGGSSWWT